MAVKIFVKRVFTIFASNASFLHIIANLQNQLSELCNIYHVIVHFLPKKHCFVLVRDKIAYVWAKNFQPSPNFSAGAPREIVLFKIRNCAYFALKKGENRAKAVDRLARRAEVMTNSWCFQFLVH